MFQDNIKSTARYIYSQIINDAEYANECKVLSDLLDCLDAQTMLKDDASDLLGNAPNKCQNVGQGCPRSSSM